jgi:hypothetical protein
MTGAALTSFASRSLRSSTEGSEAGTDAGADTGADVSCAAGSEEVEV